MKQKKSIKNLIMQGGILAVAGILVRVIGLVYRIPMANIIGQQASGVYQASFEFYNIMLILSSYGLPMAVSKLISDRVVKRRYRDAKKIFVSSMAFAVSISGVIACITFFGANFIERVFYEKYKGIAMPLRVLAPTIFIVAMLGVFRGFYQGQGTTIPTALSQLIEQIVNAIVSILGSYILVKSCTDSAKLAGYGAAGGTLGTAFGAFAALVILVFIYIIYKPSFDRKVRRDTYSVDEPYSEIFRTILFTTIPIIIGQTFYQISALIDTIMFGKLMGAAGFTDTEIQGLTGNYGQTYVTLTGVVMGIASAMSASMLPSIVASKARREYEEINEKISATIKTNMFVAIPSFVGLAVLGEPIVRLLFPRYDVLTSGMMLKLGGIAVVFYTISTVTSSALQGIDRMNVPVGHSFISLVIHVILVFALLRFTNLGIYALVIGTTTFPVVIMILNLVSLNRYIGYNQEVIKTFLVPLICSLAMGIAVILIYNLFIFISGSNFISIIFAFAAAAIVYFGLIFLCRRRRLY